MESSRRRATTTGRRARTRHLPAGSPDGSRGRKPLAQRGTKSYAIDRELLKRFPCAEIPNGEQVKLANEFGVSRELVRRRVAKLRMARVPKRRVRRLCARCGERPAYGRSAFCVGCLWIELPCEFCGAPVRRLASRLASRYGKSQMTPKGEQATYRGRVFCSLRCFGRWSVRNLGPKRKVRPDWRADPAFAVPARLVLTIAEAKRSESSSV